MDFILFAQDQVTDENAASAMAMLTSNTGRVVICLLFAALGLFFVLPPRGQKKQFVCGAVLLSTAILALLWPSLSHLPSAPAYFILEALAVLGGLGTISSRSPVYSAIWFASSLLAIGALLLLAGAQFLGLATVAVYAGAIVVTFLFVLMLAQPEGQSVYDRLGWGWMPTLCASLAGTSLAGIVAVGVSSGLGGDAATSANAGTTAAQANTRDEVHAAVTAGLKDVLPDDARLASVLRKVKMFREPNGQARLTVHIANNDFGVSEAQLAKSIRDAGGTAIPASCRIDISTKDILATDHVANFGGELFSRHLISIQVAGVLLLVALVGAIAMAIHGKDLDPSQGVAIR